MPNKQTAKQLPLKPNTPRMISKSPKDPKPSVDRIEDLAKRILNGDILLPKFQRQFVWGKSKILNLLDSIANGYPIGSILLWQSSSQELKNENQIADLDVELPKPDYPVNYLLDGQQRLSVICGAYYWQPTFDPNSKWNIVYDLRKESFLHLRTLADPPIYQIRVNKLAEASVFFEHVFKLENSEEADKALLAQRAKSLFDRFKDYKIATVTLNDMPIEDIAPIFERINSTGTPLTIVDLMRAATWKPDFDLLDSINEILDAVEDKDFHRVDALVILRVISVAAGGQFNSGSISDLRDKKTSDLSNAIKDVKEAYKKTVDFATTQLNVPSSDIVPYANQLAVLTEIFRRLDHPTKKQNLAISEWFWKTSYSGHFAGWSTSVMSNDLEAINDFVDNKTEDITLNIPQPFETIWTLRTFGLRNALTKLLAILLAHQNPVDLLNGQKIDLSKALAWNNSKEFHHFFPREYLKQNKVPKDKINCLANFVLLTSYSNKKIGGKAPSIYLKEVEKAAGPDLEIWLQSNLISGDAYEAAKKDDFHNFIDLRSKTIHKAIITIANWSKTGQTFEMPEDDEES